jgi:cytochrome c-type biogenesis protein CcmH
MTAPPKLRRHCERSEAIQNGRGRRNQTWIASAALPPRNDDRVRRRGRRRAARLAFLLLFAGLLFAAPASAVEPDERLADPALEARAREISKELRCVVCQNQSIDDSNAGIARDLRILVRERLVAGDRDAQVIDYVVARYGDYVLLDPPFKPSTWALWIGPPLMAGIVVFLIVMFLRSWQIHRAAREEVDGLSPSDRAELDALVERLAANAPPPPPKSAYRAELGEPRHRPDAPTDAPRGDDPAKSGRR